MYRSSIGKKTTTADDKEKLFKYDTLSKEDWQILTEAKAFREVSWAYEAR